MKNWKRYKDVFKDFGSEIKDAKIKEKWQEVYDFFEARVSEEDSTIIISDEKLVLYTDGACRGNPGPGSWAYVILQNKKILEETAEVDKHTTNNRMELLAVIRGLQRALELDSKGVQLFSDSQYVLNGIQKWVPNWKKRGWKKADNKTPINVELWQELDEINAKLNVEYHWVKGHSGNEYNEKVDGLANDALDFAGF